MTIETRIEPKVKTTADVLRHAARIIEERGWHQGAYESAEDGAVCALGAIGVASTGRADWTALYTPDCVGMNGAVGALSIHLVAWIPDWNDAPGRTAAEVIAALRAAADAAEQS